MTHQVGKWVGLAFIWYALKGGLHSSGPPATQNLCQPNLVAGQIGHLVIIVWAIKCNLQHTVNATISKRCEVGFVNVCGGSGFEVWSRPQQEYFFGNVAGETVCYCQSKYA